MAPMCTPFGRMGRHNRTYYPEAWQRSYDIAGPLGQFCGVVALSQLNHERHFICEQPWPSDLFLEQPWPEVLTYSNVDKVIYDRCMTQLILVSPPDKGSYVKKRSAMIASSDTLLAPFRNLTCAGRHTHIEMSGRKRQLKECEVWTWDEAERVATGISNLAKKGRHGGHQSELAYPEIAAGPDAPDGDEPERAPPRKPGRPRKYGINEVADRKATTCKGCKNMKSKNDPLHSREQGQCRFPDDDSITHESWVCPGCRIEAHRSHPSHTGQPGDCRWATAQVRMAP